VQFGILKAMQTRLPIEWTPSTAEEPSSLKVTIVHDDLPSGIKAKRALATIGKNFEGQLQLCRRLWRTNLLDDPGWFGLALADGVDADILVIATSSSNELKGSLKHWIEACLARKTGTGAAIVALLADGETTDSANGSVVEFIHCAAQNAGLDFFASESSWHNRLNERQEHLSLRIQTERAVFFTKAHCATTQFTPYQHWDINE
jgi:hypothetical protein